MSSTDEQIVTENHSLETEVLALISATSEGMFANDENGRILIWNQAAEAILGYSPAEVLGKACYDIVSGREFSGIPFCFKGCSVLAMARAHHAPKAFTIETTTKSNEKIWIQTKIVVLSTEKWQGPVTVHLFKKVPRPETDPRKQDANTLPFVTPELSPREKDVLALIARCMVAKEIASHLGISTETARTHIQRILRKLHTHSKLEAVIIAMQYGLLNNGDLQAVQG